MTMPAAPHYGARFELELSSAEPASPTRYDTRVHLPGARCDYDLLIGQDGSCTLNKRGCEPPGDRDAEPWIRAYLQALGRQLFRGAQRGEPWPRRLSRWREPNPHQ